MVLQNISPGEDESGKIKSGESKSIKGTESELLGPENDISVKAASVSDSQAEESDIAAEMERSTLKADQVKKPSEPDEPTGKIAPKESKQPCLTKSEHAHEIVSTEVAFSKRERGQIRREKATTGVPTVGCAGLESEPCPNLILS